MNEDEMAEVVAAVGKRRTLHGRVGRWLAGRAETWIFVASIPAGLFLATLGVDGYLASHALVLASPVLAVAVVAFISHAWRQNEITVRGGDQLNPAEPGHLADLADEVAQPVAMPTTQPQVTVTVRSLPTAQPTIPIPGAIPAKAALPIYAPWSDPDGDD